METQALDQITASLTDLLKFSLPYSTGIKDQAEFCQAALTILKNLEYELPNQHKAGLDGIIASYQADLDRLT